MTAEQLESALVLRIDGEIDLATTGRVTAAVDEADLDRITALVLDLQEVEFLDLAACRALIGVRDRCWAQGVHLTVIGPLGPARRIFTLTHADKELDLVDAGILAGR